MILSRCSWESPPWRAAGIAATAAQSLGEVVHLAAGPGEDQGGRAVLQVQDAAQGGELVGAPHDIRHLPDAGRLALCRLLGLDADAGGLAEVCLGHAGDGPGDRRGEERRLAIQGQCRQDLLEVVGKAHVEHLVGLVEDHHLHLVEADRAAIEVIHAAPGGRHHDVHAAGQSVELGGDRLATVHGHHAHAQLTAVLVHGLGHLHGELASGCEDERRRPTGTGPLARDAATVRGAACLAVRVEAQREPLEHRQGEGRRLAGAGRRLGEQVPALEQGRDRGQLDGGGLLVAEGGERPEKTGVEGEGVKARGIGGGFGHGCMLAPICHSPREQVASRQTTSRFGTRNLPIERSMSLRPALDVDWAPPDTRAAAQAFRGAVREPGRRERALGTGG